jgi:uncharacterized protein
MTEKTLVDRVAATVREQLAGEPTGHDWWHTDRVRRVACRIATIEGANMLVVELAAILHDLGDVKVTGDIDASRSMATEVLTSAGAGSAITHDVQAIINDMSFQGAGVQTPALSLEGRCVQDADRLDAIGAIGVARVFAYGGHIGRPIHDPDEPPVLHATPESYRTHTGTSINHFHEKLLLLRDRMTTSAGIRIAERRHQFLVRFLEEFELEWDGGDLLKSG